MANRSFIVAVVLLVGAAILFSGFSGGTGMAYQRSLGTGPSYVCAEAFSDCMSYAAEIHGSCMESNSYLKGCRTEYDVNSAACKQDYYACLRQ